MNYKQTINSFSAWTVDRLTSARRATLTMLATFLIAMTAQTAWAQDPATIGSISYNSTLGAYEINSVSNLKDLAVYVNGSGNYSTNGSETASHNCAGLTFKMTADITFNTTVENNFTPIGIDSYKPFYGTFDGQRHTISGININRSELDAEYQGVFGFLCGTVENLVVSNCSIVARSDVGAIAGCLATATIENCSVSNNVTLSGNSYVGGIVGASDLGTIKGCVSAAAITGTRDAGIDAYDLGGIVGATLSDSKVTDNLFTGTISDNLNQYIGAIVGENPNGGLDNNLYTSAGFGGIGAEGSATGSDGAGARKAYTVTLGTYVSMDGTATAHGTVTNDGDISITSYANNSGIMYTTKSGGTTTSTIYAGATETIKLKYTGTVAEGCGVGYKVNDGEATAGNTITMPAADATITEVDMDLWGNGNGSATNPYVISTTAGLDLLAQKVNAGNGYSGKYFKLDADITYDKNTPNNFTPIGIADDKSFEGIFDGNGKTISGLNINLTTDKVGLFGNVNGATIKDVKLDNSTIKGQNFVGGIVGNGGSSNTTIENCAVTSNVTAKGSSWVGGIVGQYATVRGCISAAAVSGVQYVGGIIGDGASVTIECCLYTGSSVTASAGRPYNGAITGSNDNATLTANYYTQATIGGCNGSDVDGARKAVVIGAAEGVTITPTGEATTYNVSGITAYDGADYHILGYDSKLYAGATEAVKLTVTYTGTPETGYEFSSFNFGESVTVTANEGVYTLTVPASDVTVDVVNQAIIYNITYKGVEDEGVTFTEDNPEAYTVEDDNFTLNNPSKEDYVFAGWTFEGQTTPTTTVTIAKGSTGDKTFTANWRSMEEPNTAVVNVEETPVAIGGEVYYQPTEDVKQIFKGDNASFAISAEASNRMEVTAEGSVKFSKGPSTTIALPKLIVGAKMRVNFYGQVKVKDTEVRRNSIYTRGRGDSSSDGMIDLVSGAEYEVLKDGDLVLTIVLEEEEVVLEGISVTEPEPSDGSIVVTAKNKYWTFSSDKDVKVPTGVKVYTCQLNSDQTAVVITNITSKLGGVIKAGNGVLLSSAPGDYVFVPSTETASETKTYENNLLEPVLEATNFASGEYYVLKDNEFHPILANDSNVPANKAVLRVAKKSAARLEIIGDDDVKTAINGIAVEEDGAEWYTISGQRIDKPTKKGLYIKNGKKVIIK